MTNFTLIESQQKLDILSQTLKKTKSLAIDLECENNLHHYGAYVTLIQISDGKNVWIVDTLKIKNISSLLDLFKDKNIQKVFHDVNFDLRIINNQWGCNLSNVFDTQLAANFLGKEKVGLGSLLEEYFKIKADKKFQRVDWTKRPLSEDKLVYAANDVAYLLQLKEKLEQELIKNNRVGWLVEECNNFENQEWNYKEQTYLDVSGVKSMSNIERSIFHILFDYRKRLAQKVDKPPFMVISNKQLIAFAKNPPHNWVLVKRVHPIVADEANNLKKLVSQAKPEFLEKTIKERLSSKQYQWTKDLTELRKKLASKIGIKGHLIVNNDQIWDIASMQSLDALRTWQKDIVGSEKLILDILRA